MPPKKSKGAAVSRTFNVGDIVLAKMKGFPAWPGHIVPTDQMAPDVEKEKPKSGNAYLVQFFPAGDHSWLSGRDLAPLTNREIEAFLAEPSKKKGELMTAYRTAQDPTAWKEELRARVEEAERLRNEAAELDSEDQLASDTEATTGQKRKRKSEAGPSKKATKAKKPKVDTSKAKKSDSEGPKKASAVNADDHPGMKQVKDWRHKLQKAFLPKDGIISKDDLSKCNEYFDAMETFEMEKEWLVTSKLAKVLKRVALLESIPLDDQYHFKDRSAALANKWNAQFGTDGGAEDSTGPAPTPSTATASQPATGTSLPVAGAEEATSAATSSAPKIESQSDEPSFAPPPAAAAPPSVDPVAPSESVKVPETSEAAPFATGFAPAPLEPQTNGISAMQVDQPPAVTEPASGAVKPTTDVIADPVAASTATQPAAEAPSAAPFATASSTLASELTNGTPAQAPTAQQGESEQQQQPAQPAAAAPTNDFAVTPSAPFP